MKCSQLFNERKGFGISGSGRIFIAFLIYERRAVTIPKQRVGYRSENFE